MISVSDALSHLFDLVTATEVEAVPLRQAAGRVLARDVVATRTQPPFAASSMDGYALRQTEVEPDAMFKVIGEAAAAVADHVRSLTQGEIEIGHWRLSITPILAPACPREKLKGQCLVYSYCL